MTNDWQHRPKDDNRQWVTLMAPSSYRDEIKRRAKAVGRTVQEETERVLKCGLDDGAFIDRLEGYLTGYTIRLMEAGAPVPEEMQALALDLAARLEKWVDDDKTRSQLESAQRVMECIQRLREYKPLREDER